MTKREELINELDGLRVKYNLNDTSIMYIVDFILADRRRICEPLIKLKKLHEGYHNALDGYDDYVEATNKVIDVAGLGGEE